ncbi:MAG: hypothetical protein WA154_06175 [Moraxellaceae bacterium]
MNKREDVLYLTLVDFFLQMLFLVMIVLLAYIYVQQQHSEQSKEWEELAAKYNIKTVRELIDKLTTLAPIENLEAAKEAGELVEKYGGIDKARDVLEKGQGKPPCIFSADGKTPKAIAIFVSTNSNIQLISFEPELASLAQEIGVKNLQQGMSWSLRGFVSTWMGAITKYPSCRYTVVLRERSQLTRPRDTVQSVFYAQIRR